MKRALIMAYSLLSYIGLLFVVVYSIGFFGNVYVPRSIDSAAVIATRYAASTNAALLLLFALQHSSMSRPAFKRWICRWIPPAMERSTYVLCSGIAAAMILVFWQPMGGVVWKLEDAFTVTSIHAIYYLGWAFMLWSTFLISHLDYLGLKQAYSALCNYVYIRPRFVTPSIYRAVRHPVYLGWLVIFWATPVMTISHLFLSLGLSAYVLIGISLEEHDLIKAYPEYRQYRRKVPALLPSPRRHLNQTDNTFAES